MDESEQQQAEPEVLATPVVATAPRLAGIGELFKSGFNDVTSRLGLVGSVLLVFVLITGIGFGGLGFGAFSLSRMGQPMTDPVTAVVVAVLGLLLYVIIMIAYMAASIALIRVALKRQEGAAYFESFKWTLVRVWPIFLIALYMQLVVSAGYLFLIIPGIALAIYTSFSLFAYVKEDHRGMQALLRSIDLVYGNFWGVLWRLLVLSAGITLSLVLPIALLTLVAVATAPILVVLVFIVGACAYAVGIVWAVFSFARLFESLEAIKPVERFNVNAYKKIRTLLIVAAIIGIPVLIGWNLFSFSSENERGGWQGGMDRGPGMFMDGWQ